MSDGEDTTIRVNFGKPIALFPLDSVSLLPQQVLPLHIFEPRYRQMVEHALDGSGQFAMAVFKGSSWKQEYHGRPPLMQAVCVGQIAQHEKVPDGRFNLLLQGVCRARITEELEPDESRLYRAATLRPIDGEPPDDESLSEAREYLEEALEEGPLSQFAASRAVLEYVQNVEVPTSALLELVSFTMLSGKSLRYRLLAEGDILKRAAVIRQELALLEGLIRRASEQHPESWPKGMSWN
jgi:hypothetical protein